MLATGYGIENIDCPELQNVRKYMNSSYTNIIDAIENIKPLLCLLNDGYYLLADIPHNITDGTGRFFYSVPNKLTYNIATSPSYYNSSFLTCLDGFPAYIYPTQSTELYNPERVKYYEFIMKQNSSPPPRALAYYEQGFISALLDGHHKACAAAVLSQKLNCLTIIKANGFSYTPSNIYFSQIKVPVHKLGLGLLGNLNIKKTYLNGYKDANISINEYILTNREFDDIIKNNAQNRYPTIEELSNMYSVHLENEDITDELIESSLNSRYSKRYMKLYYILDYFMKNNPTKAYFIAKQVILKISDDYQLCKYAWKILIQFQNNETEQFIIDYIVNHDKTDKYWNIANSYWEKNI